MTGFRNSERKTGGLMPSVWCGFAGSLRKATSYVDLRRSISATASTNFGVRAAALTSEFSTFSTAGMWLFSITH